MLILVLVLVLKDSLRTFFKSLSLSWSLGVRSLSLSLSLGVRSLLTSLPIFDDYFIANVTGHDHCTIFQFRLHTIPYNTNTRCFTVILAGRKLWNAINTDIRGKCSLNAFKTAYKKRLIIFYH